MKPFARLVSRLTELRPVAAEHLSALGSLLLRLALVLRAHARGLLLALEAWLRARRLKPQGVQLQLFDPDMLAVDPKPRVPEPPVVSADLEAEPAQEQESDLLDRINAYSIASTAR